MGKGKRCCAFLGNGFYVHSALVSSMRHPFASLLGEHASRSACTNSLARCSIRFISSLFFCGVLDTVNTLGHWNLRQ